jgi:thioesterase domain-containing protein
MAGEFLADIRKVQPHGPYYLGGFSGGGVVAYEIACLLREQGEEVPLLVLLDSMNPAMPRTSLPGRFARTYRQGLRHVALRCVARLVHALRKAQQKLVGYRFLPDQFDLRDRELQESFRAALARYAPRPYAGDVLLVRCGVEKRAGEDDEFESNGWRPLVSGKFQVITVECEHDELLATHAAVTARFVRTALDAARTGAFQRTP